MYFKQIKLFEQGLHGCSNCKRIKLVSEFNKNNSKTCGLASQCRICVAEWKKANPEKMRANKTEWRKTNPEKDKSQARKRRAKDIAELRPTYLRRLLEKQYGVPFTEIQPLDLEEKREQLLYTREIKLITKKLENEKIEN